MRSHFFYRTARAVAGVILLTAAAAKLYGLHVSSVSEVGWLSQPSVQWTVSVWEVALGLWLVSGRSPRGAVRAAMWTFGTFAVVSLWLGLNGVAQCGCLGAVPANPWGVFVLDSCLLALLFTASKLHPESRPQPHELRLSPIAGSVLVAGILIAASAAFGIVRYGSVHAALLRLQDYDVTLDDAYIDFGTVAVGQTVDRTVVVRNWSDKTIRVVGAPRNCSLVSIRTDLPLDVPPGERRNVILEMSASNASEGVLTIQTALWTDSAKARSLPYRVGCRVGSQPSASSAEP
jgi:hypothetical protein